MLVPSCSFLRTNLLYALARLVDSLVDLLSVAKPDDGVDKKWKDDLADVLSTFPSGTAEDDDLAVNNVVRRRSSVFSLCTRPVGLGPVAVCRGQMLYLKQAVLHMQSDVDSTIRALMATTTEFAAGGLELISAVWKQDLSEVLSAVKTLAGAIQKYQDNQPQAWYVVVTTPVRGSSFFASAATAPPTVSLL